MLHSVQAVHIHLPQLCTALPQHLQQASTQEEGAGWGGVGAAPGARAEARSSPCVHAQQQQQQRLFKQLAAVCSSL